MAEFWRWLVLVGLLACVWSFAAVPVAAADGQLAVIVAHATNLPNLDLDDLQLIFKRKRQFLGDDLPARPVNLPGNHPLRRYFSQQVLHRTPEELEDYWHKQYFNGITPPFVVASEEAVLRFVSSTPGAIGYVPLCLVDHRVKVILTLDHAPPCPKPL